MAKALKDWSIHSMAEPCRKNFALFCSEIIDKNAQIKAEHDPLRFPEDVFISGNIFDIETKENEGFKTVAIRTLDVVSFGDDKIIYFAEDVANERYYFSIWGADPDTMSALVRCWLKTLRQDGVDAYMRAW